MLKDRSTCILNDYMCYYWKTDQQYTDNQVACYTPKIPYDQRPLFPSTSANFQFYLQSGLNVYTCSKAADCMVNYNFYYTPEILAVIPQHFYFGSPVQLRMRPKNLLGADNPGINNPVENKLLDVKLGINNCIFSTAWNNEQPEIKKTIAPLTGYWSGYNDAIVNCYIGDGIPSTVPNQGFLLNFETGMAAIHESLLKTDLSGNVYAFKAFPVIEKINLHQVSSYGETDLVIGGRGFIQSSNDAKLSVVLEDVNNPCTITQISDIQITCRSKAISDALNTKISNTATIFTGGPGLRLKRFAITTDCPTAMTADPYPAVGLDKEDIILETATQSVQGTNYLEYIEGYFNAPYTAEYRFYSAVDDSMKLFLTINTVKTPVLEITGYTSFREFSKYTNQVSSWIQLDKGLYYLQAYHCQAYSSDNFVIGTEIKFPASRRAAADTGETNPYAKLNFLQEELSWQIWDRSLATTYAKNQVTRLQQVIIKPTNVARDIYEIKALGAGSNYVFFCKDPDPLALDPYLQMPFNANISAADFMKLLAPFLSVWNLVIRKIPINENQEYLDDATKIDDATYSPLLTFGTFYLSQTLTTTLGTKVTTGTFNGYSFIILIDQNISARSKRLETQCFYRYEPIGSPTQTITIPTTSFPLPIVQTVSNGLSGTYQLLYGTEFTEQISPATNPIDILNKIPKLANKVQVAFTSNTPELVKYVVTVSDIYENLVTEGLTVKTQGVLGGVGDVTTVDITEFPDTSLKDTLAAGGQPFVFMSPIPSDYIVVKATKPQIRVYSNGMEAVCLNNCDFSLNASYITLASFSLSGNVVTITFDVAFTENVTLIKILLTNFTSGTKNMNCLSIAVAPDKMSLTCTLDNVIMGKYYPIIINSGGIINDVVSVKTKSSIDITPTFTTVLPANASIQGESLITITGTHFPVLPMNGSKLSDLSVTYGTNLCTIRSATQTQVTCVINPLPTPGTGPLTIAYNEISDTTNIFSYNSNLVLPEIAQITPNSISPGEKQFMTITFQDILENDPLYPFSGIKVEMISTTDSNYVIKMNTVSLIGTDLKVKYGGSQMGTYKVQVQLADGVYAINSATTVVSELKLLTFSPDIGSSAGGTIVTITGKNFLTTQVNQVVYIGDKPCNYIDNTNTETEIKCRTTAQTDDANLNKPLDIVIEQMIQFPSTCVANSGSCKFTYSAAKTAMITSISPSVGVVSMSPYLNGSPIVISGNNFGYATIDDIPSEFIYDWGKIVVDKANAGTKPDSVIFGTVSGLTKYGAFEFLFSNAYGYAKLASVDGNKIIITTSIKDPAVVNVSPTSISTYGGILEFTFDTIEGFSLATGVYTFSICGNTCTPKISGGKLICNVFFKTQCTQASITSLTISSYMERTNVSVAITGGITIVPAASLPQVSGVTVNSITAQSSTPVTITPDANKAISKVSISVSFSSISGSPEIKLVMDDIFFDNGDQIRMKATTQIAGTAYSYELLDSDPENYIVHGLHSVYFHMTGTGYISPPGSPIKISIPLLVDEASLATTSFGASFTGGNEITVPTKNYNFSIGQQQAMTVCGLKAIISSATMTAITIQTPKIVKYDLFKSTSLINDLSLLQDLTSTTQYDPLTEIYYAPTATQADIALIMDNNPYSSNNNKVEYIGVKVKDSITANLSMKIYLGFINIHIGETSNPGDFLDSTVEGSNDGVAYTKIFSFLDSKIYLTFSWRRIDMKWDNGVTLYKYIRLTIPNVNAKITGVKFYGRVVYDSVNADVNCPVKYTDKSNTAGVTMPFVVNYQTSKTFFLVGNGSGIDPTFGSSYGGNTVKFYLSLPGSAQISIPGSTVIKVYVQENLIPTTGTSWEIVGTQIVVTTTMVKNNFKTSKSVKKLEITLGNIGKAFIDSNDYYLYLDRWSDTRTWGGEFIPATNMETAYVKDMNILLDVNNINMNMIVVENGSITVEDTEDYTIRVKNILIRTGQFIVGTESKPFTHKFDLTLVGDKEKDPNLPIFGNKVLAVLEGQLDLHGVKRTPTWTMIAKTVQVGDTTLELSEIVDWTVGEEIVIASSSFYMREAEQRTITAVTVSGDGKRSILTVDKAFEYVHYGAIETYPYTSSEGVAKTVDFDMRAEVGLLTRNIKIHGDETSDEGLYGSHIMLTSMTINMDMSNQHVEMNDHELISTTSPTSGRIEYVEIFKAGQGHFLGRYPIHFHMIGSVKGSYVRGCAIHHTYNRAVTIHGSSYFLVENNVAYDVYGHTFFLEDSVEQYNVIKNNLGIQTKISYTLLNSDYTPTTFWITNPLNYIEGNHAAGSDNYGFWLQLPISPTGLSQSVVTCPREIPLGSFKDNVAHSNLLYGSRIFQEFNPKTRPCLPIDYVTNFPSQAVFEGGIFYRNRKKGFETERLGNVVVQNIKSADNVESNIEISDLMPFVEFKTDLNNLDVGSTQGAHRRVIVKDSFILGISQNPIPFPSDYPLKTRGVVAPRADNFLFTGITFFNFQDVNIAAFGTCSRCEISSSSTDSDARTIDVEKIIFDGTEVNRVIWNYPWKAIIRDLDGTFSGLKTTGGDASAYVTRYYAHLASAECTGPDAKFDSGIICDGSKVQIRRVAFYNAIPYSRFGYKPIKIAKYDPGIIDRNNDPPPSSGKTIEELSTIFSLIPFKEDKDPSNGWAIPFVTGYSYLISFGEWFQNPLNWDRLTISRSMFWAKTDNPINLMFNYTERRDEFQIKSGKYISTNVSVPTTCPILNYTLDTLNEAALKSPSLMYGTYSNDILKAVLGVHVNGLNSTSIVGQTNTISNDLVIKAIQCANDNCGDSVHTVVPIETTARYWSDPNSWTYTNNQLPVEGEDVEIRPGWNMVFDLPVSPVLKSLTINGKLSVLTTSLTDVTYELKAKKILLLGGILEVGTREYPLPGNINFKITLVGSMFDQNLVVSNEVKLSNKILAFANNATLYGEDRAPYNCKLLKTVQKFENTLLVQPNLKWKAGDEFIVSTTTHFNEQTERFIIKTYDPLTGQIELDQNKVFNYSHYGDTGDATTRVPGITLPDERADVLMLTRNIKIGADPNDVWGCMIAVTQFMEIKSHYFFAGNVNMTNVEVINCGQVDMAYPGLRLINLNAGRTIDPVVVEYHHNFKQMSFHDNNYTAIEFYNSSDIMLDNIIIYAPKKFGVSATLNSHNILIQNSFVVDCKIRDSMVAVNTGNASIFKGEDPLSKQLDMNACFYIGPEDEEANCFNIILSGNTCGGSSYLGFVFNGIQCGEVSTPQISVAPNIAYATMLGFFITNSQMKTCLQSDNMIAYNNYGWGIASHPMVNTIGEVKFNNLVSSNNLKGLVILVGSDVNFPRVTLTSAVIIGQNPNNPICFDISKCIPDDVPCIQSGLMLSGGTLGSKTLPLSKKTLPINSQMKMVSTWGSFFDASSIVFFNFNDDQNYLNNPNGVQCPFYRNNPSYAIRSNDKNLDHFAIHNFNYVTIKQVADNNFIYLHPPDPSTIGDLCGAFPCSAPSTVIVHFKNIATNSENGEWVTAMGNDNTIISATSETAKRYFATESTDCVLRESWNAFLCNSNNRFGNLIFKNNEAFALQRSIAPVEVISTEVIHGNYYSTTLNSYSAVGYKSQLRYPVFPAVVMLDKKYAISFASSTPTTMIFQLADINWRKDIPRRSGGVIVRIKYYSPQTVVVLKNNENEIKNNYIYGSVSLEIAKSENYVCGTNIWTPDDTSLEFYITNEPDCVLYLNTINSIQLNLRLSVTLDEFYATNGPNQMIYNIAAVMKIAPEQIRITKLLEGSTIVNLQILEIPPKNSAVGTANSKISVTEFSSNHIYPSSSTNIPDLDSFATQMVDNIKTRKLSFKGEVTSMDYVISKSSGTFPSTSSISVNDNGQSGTTTSTNTNTSTNRSPSTSGTGNAFHPVPYMFPNISHIETPIPGPPPNKNHDTIATIGGTDYRIFIALVVSLPIFVTAAVIVVVCYIKKRRSLMILYEKPPKPNQIEIIQMTKAYDGEKASEAVHSERELVLKGIFNSN